MRRCGRACSRAEIEPRRAPPRMGSEEPVPMPPTDDARLMEPLRDDPTGESLRTLYRTYAGELLGFALNALSDRETAEEIVQETFTRAWRHADRYDAARGSVRTWLYQIARHAIIDARRRASARPAPAGAADHAMDDLAGGISIE